MDVGDRRLANGTFTLPAPTSNGRLPRRPVGGSCMDSERRLALANPDRPEDGWALLNRAVADATRLG